MNEFGNNLYTLRKSKGMTQQDIADKLGVTNKAVSKWETGEAFPETAQLVPLADMFGVTVDDLLRGRAAASESEQKVLLPDSEQELAQKSRKKRARLAGRISSILMLSAAAVYLLLGFVWELWHPGWVIFPVSAIASGIISLILEKE